MCAFIDAEHAFDAGYAQKLGIKLDELLVSQPDCGEQALEITDILVRSGGVDLVVVDSVAALTPKAEIDGEMGDAHMGLQARLMSQALRKLTAASAKQGCAVVFINQLRQKIGVVFGNPETTTGGNALKFYASVRLDIRRTGQIKNGEDVIGSRTRVKVVKNKLAPPFREAEFEILYGIGINRLGELLDLSVDRGLIEKSGAWYSLDGERLAQGRDRRLRLAGRAPGADRAAARSADGAAESGLRRCPPAHLPRARRSRKPMRKSPTTRMVTARERRPSPRASGITSCRSERAPPRRPSVQSSTFLESQVSTQGGRRKSRS